MRTGKVASSGAAYRTGSPSFGRIFFSKSSRRYDHRAQSTWEQMKNAVRDAWDRVTGKTPVGSR
jgi:hypothetical protein